MCRQIQNGSDVEAICNVIIHVSETFWDMPKLMSFFEALKALLYKQGSDWLVYIQNPLLFYMTLINFFKDAKE